MTQAVTKVFNSLRLRELRGSKKQAEVSDATGVNAATISLLETGKQKNPVESTVTKLASYFGVPTEEFWTDKPATVVRKKKPASSKPRRLSKTLKPQNDLAPEAVKAEKLVEFQTLIVVDTFKDGSLFVRDSQGSRYYRATQIN